MNRLLSIIVLLSALLFSYNVNAHIKVLSTSPSNGQVIEASPKVIDIEYSKDVRLTSFEMIHQGRVIEIDYNLNYAPSSNFTIDLPKLEPGNYTFTWTIMGGDGHKMNGKINFSISKS